MGISYVGIFDSTVIVSPLPVGVHNHSHSGIYSVELQNNAAIFNED